MLAATAFDRKRARVHILMDTTAREYNLWMQALDGKYRFDTVGINGLPPEVAYRVAEAMRRRAERREVVWRRAWWDASDRL